MYKKYSIVLYFCYLVIILKVFWLCLSLYIKSKSGSFLATQNLCCIVIFCKQNDIHFVKNCHKQSYKQKPF